MLAARLLKKSFTIDFCLLCLVLKTAIVSSSSLETVAIERPSYGDVWMTLIPAVALLHYVRQVCQTLVSRG